MFKWLLSWLPPHYSVPLHQAAMGWQIKPANWPGRYCFTAFWEDLPETCYDCGTKTEEIQTDPLMIEGQIQYMRVIRICPKGCGRTEWIA